MKILQLIDCKCLLVLIINVSVDDWCWFWLGYCLSCFSKSVLCALCASYTLVKKQPRPTQHYTHLLCQIRKVAYLLYQRH